VNVTTSMNAIEFAVEIVEIERKMVMTFEVEVFAKLHKNELRSEGFHEN